MPAGLCLKLIHVHATDDASWPLGNRAPASSAGIGPLFFVASVRRSSLSGAKLKNNATVVSTRERAVPETLQPRACRERLEIAACL